MYFEARYLGVDISIDTYVKHIAVKTNGHSDFIVNSVIRAVIKQFKEDNYDGYTIERL